MSGVRANIWVSWSKTGRGLSSEELVNEGSEIGILIAPVVLMVLVAVGLAWIGLERDVSGEILGPPLN
jgi:hypothetical protein